MFYRLKKISLSNWILIGMILGLIVGLFLNLFVNNTFIKNYILIDNVFYLGGNIFIRLMKMILVPLVFCSIVVGVTSISKIREIFITGGRIILLYLATSFIGIFIGFAISSFFKPGVGVNMATIGTTSNATFNQTMADLVLDIIPENPLNALANSDLLSIIIVGLIIGFILVKYTEQSPTVTKIFKETNKIMINMTDIVIKFAPIGIFCLMAYTFGSLEFENIFLLSKFIGCVFLGLAIQLFLVYPFMLIIFTKVNPLRFYKKFLSVFFFAFATLSSNATIPLNIEELEEMGVPRDISSFTVPLGSTINKNGTIIMQSATVMFAAQYIGMDLGISVILTAIFTILIASSSTSSVPLSGLVSLTMVFSVIGLPVEIIGALVSIDCILDTCRTAVNVTGDAICTIIVSCKNKSFDKDVFNDKKEHDKSALESELI